jgi:hypothetical protein
VRDHRRDRDRQRQIGRGDDSSRDRERRVLVLLGVAGFVAFQLWTAAAAAGFDARRFPAANASGDLATMEDEAHRAVHDRALVGWSTARVRRELGPPSHIGERRHRFVWHLGMIDDVLGPGDEGAFFVQFDPSWRRVVSARVDQTGG